jgi:hypothetical protein
MNQSVRHLLSFALVLTLYGSTLFAQRRVAARGSAQASVNRNANVNANRNTNINANRNVNVNVNRDIDVHGGYYGGGCCYHPVATAAAVVVTAAVVGSIVHTIPPSCTAAVVNGVTYQHCGSTWYQPQFVGTSASYVVVAAPR